MECWIVDCGYTGESYIFTDRNKLVTFLGGLMRKASIMELLQKFQNQRIVNMKCKRGKNFAANQKFDRKEDKKYNYHKKVNWFRAFMLMPWWDRLHL